MLNVTDKAKVFIKESLLENLNEEKSEIKDLFMESVHSGLSWVDSNSMAHPDVFIDALHLYFDNFTYIAEDEEIEDVVFSIPNIESFSYLDELIILKFIVEGTAGSYFELPESYISELSTLDPQVLQLVSTLPGLTSSNVMEHKRFRMIPSASQLYLIIQEALDTELTLFPYSNMSPINLFEGMEDYVSDNFSSWVSNSIKEGIEKAGGENV